MIAEVRLVCYFVVDLLYGVVALWWVGLSVSGDLDSQTAGVGAKSDLRGVGVVRAG